MKNKTTHERIHYASDDAFMKTLHERVNAFFAVHGNMKKATGSIVFKTIVLFTIYISLYLILILKGDVNSLFSWLGWATMGILLGLIGMNVLHDKVHGSYTQSSLGQLLLEIPILFIGAESSIWQIEHNHIHHNFTNVNGVDQDINPRFLFRFSPHQKRLWFHRFQAIYAPFLYALLLFEWLTIKDFIKVIKYNKEGYLKNKEAKRLYVQIALKKLFFHIIFLGIPLWIGSSWVLVVGKYILMLSIGGIFMTLIFQLAHVTHDVQFTEGDRLPSGQNWHRFQLESTHNFAPNNRLITAILGGLNYQIEHHLFPDISHVHYRKLAPIVEKTALEFNYPYYCYPSLSAALWNHFSYLNRMGSPTSLYSRFPSK